MGCQLDQKGGVAKRRWNAECGRCLAYLGGDLSDNFHVMLLDLEANVPAERNPAALRRHVSRQSPNRWFSGKGAGFRASRGEMMACMFCGAIIALSSLLAFRRSAGDAVLDSLYVRLVYWKLLRLPLDVENTIDFRGVQRRKRAQ